MAKFYVDKERYKGEWVKPISPNPDLRVFRGGLSEKKLEKEFSTIEEAREYYDSLKAGRGKTYVDKVVLLERLDRGYDVRRVKWPDLDSNERIDL